LCSEKEFEISAVELVDFKCLVICISRSPYSIVYGFLDKLETQIGKVQSKRKKFILCGDWNIKFQRDSVQLELWKDVGIEFRVEIYLRNCKFCF
jgi:exonuclease III